MGGGPARVTDYSLGHSAVRIADTHRPVEDKYRFWRWDVEEEVVRHVADRHDADVLYHAGDEVGPLDYVRDLGFDLVRIVKGDHDPWDPDEVHGDGVVAGEMMEWPVEVDRTYRAAMAHDPRDFNMRVEREASTDDALVDDDGRPYDLVIMGHGHFSRQQRINEHTIADHAGPMGKHNHAAGRDVDRSFAVRRFWDEFPRDLQERVSAPERSFAVHRFWNGITTYRYDADELAEAYVDEERAMADVGPESVMSFEPRDGGVEELLDGEPERTAAMTD